MKVIIRNRAEEIVKEFDVNHKVTVTEAGISTIYHCKHIQPSPIIRGIKLVGVVQIDTHNATKSYQELGDLRFCNTQMKIEKLIEDKTYHTVL